MAQASVDLVDTSAALTHFLDSLGTCIGSPPQLYVDLEGNDLCRHGTLSLVTILVQPQKRVYIIDVTTLKQKAFATQASDGRTLKNILEADDVIKVFFDIRNDSDALFSLHGIRVRGIEDLQLMELASRKRSRQYLNGLARCIEHDSTVDFAEKRHWRSVKEQGRRLFNPQQGGSFAMFDARPLPPALREYCAQDVTLMPNLRSIYRAKLCDAWWSKIVEETAARIALSQTSSFDGKGRHMALGPTTWIGWNPTAAQRLLRTSVEGAGAGNTMVQPAGPSENQEIEVRDGVTPTGGTTPDNESVSVALTIMMSAALTMMMRMTHDDPEEDYGYESQTWNRGYHHCSSSDDDDEVRDLTACDSECGYCGQCPY